MGQYDWLFFWAKPPNPFMPGLIVMFRELCLERERDRELCLERDRQTERDRERDFTRNDCYRSNCYVI